MKVILAITLFGLTIGGLFLFDGFNTTPSSQTAQILLPTSSQSSLPQATAKKSRQTESLVISHSPIISSPSLPTLPPEATQSPITTIAPSSVAQSSITPSPTPSPTRTATPSPTPLPTQTATPAYQSIEIISSQPLTYAQKSSAEFKIKTIAQANCTVKVTLPSGSVSSAKGLEPKTSDESGLITWSWNISWNTKPGSGSIVVSCVKDSYSDSKTVSMTVTESK